LIYPSIILEKEKYTPLIDNIGIGVNGNFTEMM
jgi:hypothetical protein